MKYLTNEEFYKLKKGDKVTYEIEVTLVSDVGDDYFCEPVDKNGGIHYVTDDDNVFMTVEQ